MGRLTFGGGPGHRSQSMETWELRVPMPRPCTPPRSRASFGGGEQPGMELCCTAGHLDACAAASQNSGSFRGPARQRLNGHTQVQGCFDAPLSSVEQSVEGKPALWQPLERSLPDACFSNICHGQVTAASSLASTSYRRPSCMAIFRGLANGATLCISRALPQIWRVSHVITECSASVGP